MKSKKIFYFIIFCLFFFAIYFLNRFVELFRLNAHLGINCINIVLNKGLHVIAKNPFHFSLNLNDLKWTVGIAIISCLVYYARPNAGKKFRPGNEYGSARWGGEKERKKYIAPKFRDNIILSQTEFMRMGRAPVPDDNRNTNVMVIGGSGSGKTRFFVKPNLMQMNASYIVTDPKGTILTECGKLLADHHYEIKVINVKNFKKSMHYNPFAYLKGEEDILKLVDALIVNTNPDEYVGGILHPEPDRLYTRVAEI